MFDLDRRVVLLEDQPAAGQVGAAEQPEQDGAGVHPPLGQQVVRLERRARRRGGPAMGRRRGQPIVDDRVAGQRRRRDPGQLDRARIRPAVGIQAAAHDRDVAVGGDPADRRRGQAPAAADGPHRGLALGSDDRQHPLLRLADHHLERRHAGLAARDGVEVDEDAGAGPVGRLGGRAADPAGAQVLEPLDAGRRSISSSDASISSFSANGSPTWTVGRFDGSSSAKVALARTEAPPIPSRPVVEPNRMARLPGPGAAARVSRPAVEQADGHHVDQRIAAVGRVEDELAADRRHADAVAVAADAGHDAAHEVARPRVGRVAEAQGVEDRDRPGAHREDVAQDAADAGRRALVGLDRAGVVVRLDLERDGQAVARSITPAFSPGPATTPGPAVGSVRSSGWELL